MVLSKTEKKKLIINCCQRWQSLNPNPKCELFFSTPYQLLVSVVLSAQTTDKMVNRCMEPLYRKKLDLLAVLKMKEEGFYEKIKTLGLARTKAKNVIKLSEILLSRFLSKIPSNREDLESLPGVGRKTANVVLAELYKKPTCC